MKVKLSLDCYNKHSYFGLCILPFFFVYHGLFTKVIMYLSSYQKFINGQSNDYNELLMNYSQHFHNQGNLLEKDHDRVCVCVCGAGGGMNCGGK